MTPIGRDFSRSPQHPAVTANQPFQPVSNDTAPKAQPLRRPMSFEFIANYTLKPGEKVSDCLHPALRDLKPVNGVMPYTLKQTPNNGVSVMYTEPALEACGKMLGEGLSNPALRHGRFTKLNDYLMDRELVKRHGAIVRHLPPVRGGTPPLGPQTKPAFVAKYKLRFGEVPANCLHPAMLEFKPVDGKLPYAMKQQGSNLEIAYTDDALKACGRVLAQNIDEPALRDERFGKLNAALFEKNYVRSGTVVFRSLPPMEWFGPGAPRLNVLGLS